MTVVGLADGPHDVPAAIADEVAATRVRVLAHPGWRPLLSGEVGLRFKVTPVPVGDPADPVTVVAAARPRDGDGDGFVYDGTPRMRPWNPATDLPYPDGVIPEKAKRVITRGKRAPFTQVPDPEPVLPAAPTEPAFHLDAERVAEAARELGIEDVKVWSQGDPLAANEASEQLLAILGGEPAPADWSWDEDLKRWTETRAFSIEGTYRDYRVSIEATAEDTVDGHGVPARGLRYQLRVTSPNNLNLGWHGGAEWKVDVDVTESLGVALRDVRALVDRHAGPRPAGDGVLTAEQPVNYYGLLGEWNAGPDGWADPDSPAMSLADRLAIMRYRERVTAYGNLTNGGMEPQDALREVQEDPLDDLAVDSPRYWRDVIEGRGYLSANIRALRGEEGFGAPDPDAIRFLQLMREDFLAKVPESPAGKIRLYRATNTPDPWGGNEVSRFSYGPDRKPSSGVTSWAFLSTDEARWKLSGYGDYLHGEDVPFDQVLGRFGAVDGELLAAENPEIVALIDNYKFGPARERALDVLATLPDDPFAGPDLRLSATEREALASGLTEWLRNGAGNVKRRFPDLSDDDAYKVALLGGVPDGAESPWDGSAPWVAEVPWRRLRDVAVDTAFRQRGRELDVPSVDDPTVRLGAQVLAVLRSDLDTLHPSGERTNAERLRDRVTDTHVRFAMHALGRTSRDISLPTAEQVDTELSDTDRANLKAITDAGRILLSDMRQTVAREADTIPDSKLAFDPIDKARLETVAETADARYEAAFAEAQALIEANAESWIAEVAVPGEPQWPVGPLRWVPYELGLIDLKSPRFDDAEGRRFRMESRDYDLDGVIDGWTLINTGELAGTPQRLAPDAVRWSGGGGDWGSPDPKPSALAAEATLVEALAKLEEARSEWSRANEARGEVADYEVLDVEALTRTPTSVSHAITDTRVELRRRLSDWFGVTVGGSRDADPSERRPITSFRYAPEAFPDATDMDEVRSLGDAAVNDVAYALSNHLIDQSDPTVSLPAVAAMRLNSGNLSALGWGAGEVLVTSRDEGDKVTVTLRLWRDAAHGKSHPDVEAHWSDRGLSNPGYLVDRLAALRRRHDRLTKRAEAERILALREWASETLGATEQPSVKEVTDDDAQRIAKLYEHATPFIPDSLKRAAGPVQVKAQKPLEDRSDYTAADRDGTPIHRIRMTRTAEDSVYLHEYGHHVERIGVIGRAVWAFYQHRTKGEELEPLGVGYKPTEFTRADEFYDRYAGKDYGKLTSRSEAAPSELFTMGLEGVFYGNKGPSGDPIDDEYAAFILGTLLHAGERAKRYDRPSNAPGSTSGPAAPLAAEVVEDVYKLVNSRVRPEPVAIPNTPNIYPASQVERSEVVALVKNPNASEEVAGANEAIREAVRHTQRSLRAAGVETVTLYRGASPTDDPFRRQPGASGVTSWTTNPAKAWTYAEDAFVVYRAEVPVENLLSYDVIGVAATASTSQTRPLTGQEVLVVADPSVVEALAAEPVAPEGGVDLLDLLGVNRVTPATMEGNGTAGPVPI